MVRKYKHSQRRKKTCQRKTKGGRSSYITRQKNNKRSQKRKGGANFDEPPETPRPRADSYDQPLKPARDPTPLVDDYNLYDSDSDSDSDSNNNLLPEARRYRASTERRHQLRNRRQTTARREPRRNRHDLYLSEKESLLYIETNDHEKRLEILQNSDDPFIRQKTKDLTRSTFIPQFYVCLQFCRQNFREFKLPTTDKYRNKEFNIRHFDNCYFIDFYDCYFPEYRSDYDEMIHDTQRVCLRHCRKLDNLMFLSHINLSVTITQHSSIEIYQIEHLQSVPDVTLSFCSFYKYIDSQGKITEPDKYKTDNSITYTFDIGDDIEFKKFKKLDLTFSDIGSAPKLKNIRFLNISFTCVKDLSNFNKIKTLQYDGCVDLNKTDVRQYRGITETEKYIKHSVQKSIGIYIDKNEHGNPQANINAKTTDDSELKTQSKLVHSITRYTFPISNDMYERTLPRYDVDLTFDELGYDARELEFDYDANTDGDFVKLCRQIYNSFIHGELYAGQYTNLQILQN
jgi:hypothetical protein